jgi:hypothetical protein
MTVTTAPSTLDSATTGDMIDTVSAAPDTENVKVTNLILFYYSFKRYFYYITYIYNYIIIT